MIVATAGHIDHGKTLLVKRLTGVDTDRLPEEKARGISIDLGFAYLPFPGGTIGFVGPLAELFGGAPALLMGIEDPQSNAHAPNESLHEGDWKNLMRSLTHLFANLAQLKSVKG